MTNYGCIDIRRKLPRNYYKEFLELILIFLGGKLPNSTNFRQPQSFGKVDGESYLLPKMFMFKQQFFL